MSRNTEYTRLIQTTFTGMRGEVVKINRAIHANSAVLRCVDHLQNNSYAAKVAEVFDLADGTLHAVITRSVAGTITIVFKRDVQPGA